MITIRYVYVFDTNNVIFERFTNEEAARRYINKHPKKEYLKYNTRTLTLKEVEDTEIHTEYNIVFFPNDGGKHAEFRLYTGKKQPPHVDCFITCDYVTFYSSESEEHCRKLLAQNIDKALEWVNVTRFTPLSWKDSVFAKDIIENFKWNLDL